MYESVCFLLFPTLVNGKLMFLLIFMEDYKVLYIF